MGHFLITNHHSWPPHDLFGLVGRPSKRGPGPQFPRHFRASWAEMDHGTGLVIWVSRLIANSQLSPFGLFFYGRRAILSERLSV